MGACYGVVYVVHLKVKYIHVYDCTTCTLHTGEMFLGFATPTILVCRSRYLLIFCGSVSHISQSSKGISAEFWKFFFDLSDVNILTSHSLWTVKTIAVPPHTKRGSNGLQKTSRRTVYHLK